MKTRHKIIAVFCVLLTTVLSCRNEPEPEKPKVERITFSETLKNVYIDDTEEISVTVEPPEAKLYHKVEYRTSMSGYIDIVASNNSNFAFKALKRGQVIVTASVNGVDYQYLHVDIIGGNENVIPHILVSNAVIECRENERRGITASLAGGTPNDNSGFIWSYTNEDVIRLESLGNTGVFDTLSLGESVVTISHPKAQFSVNILVFVTGNDEAPVYITTDNNVVSLKTSDSNYQYAVDLWGGNGSYTEFRHELLDGGDIIDLKVNNNIGTINPKMKGIARIGISHPKAVHRLEIVVMVYEAVEYRYIDVDTILVILEEGQFGAVQADLIGKVADDYQDKFTFENEDDAIIDVQRSGSRFMITALKGGKSVLKIRNVYADFAREVLVIVNGAGSVIDNEIYITTNQNVITTEVGSDDIILTMTLVGGNEADKNNFVWTVDDGSIISAESAHGRVEYKSRAAASGSNEKFEAQALIRAKKIGTAKITLENPKAKNDFTVLVKVYKKGTFGIVPLVIDGPGIYKMGIGEKLPANLQVIAGSERNLTDVRWKSDNENVVSVSDSAGLTGMLEGTGKGITTVRVSADNVKGDYAATVIVGDDEYLRTMPYIYVENPFMSVVKGESVPFRIVCQNMSEAEIAALSVVNNTPDVMEVVAYKNNVLVTGKTIDEGEIIIGGGGLNTLRVPVRVEDYDLTPDMPYYLRTEKYIYGVVKGRNIEIGVDLVGGSAADERGIIWSIEDSHVALMEGNGKYCLVTGRNAGQTVIRVKRPKTCNELEIVLYVAEKEQDLGKVVMYAKESNMLLNIGETRYITIITNAVASQQSSFVWSNSNRNVIDMGIGGDRIKASVTAKSAGTAVITVQSGTQAPVVIYITVISDAYTMPYINVPSIVEMAAGQTLSINAVTGNIYDLMNIKWKSADETIASIYGNGKTGTVTASKGGNTIVKVTYEPALFSKNILLYVYDTPEEMASRYIIAGEQSRYVINEGDIINIGLVFGMKGYPDYEIPHINWNTEDKTKIEVTGNGKTATVKGKNQGIGVISVSDRYQNKVEIEIEVKTAGKAGKYRFSVDEKIKGILAGTSVIVPVKVFNGSNEVYNISGITYTASNTDIINVTPGEGGMLITAAHNREGQSYITLSHDLAEDARILVYTALSENSLKNAFPILVEKTNYLIKKGSSETITIETLPNADTAKLRNIEYQLEKDNGVIGIQERNKKEIVVSANSVGSDIIQVLYNADIVQRIYVSVTEGSSGPDAGYMITENIIGLPVLREYETRIETNIDYGISWKKQDDYVIDLVGSSGKSAVIKGFVPGETILTVSGGGFERHILVIVCQEEDELKAYQAMNIDQRKYRIRKNENVTVNIHSYQGRVEGETKYGDYYGNTVPYGNVIAVNSIENNKFGIKGLNEGTAAIRVKNDYYNTEIVVYVEVYPAGEGVPVLLTKRTI